MRQRDTLEAVFCQAGRAAECLVSANSGPWFRQWESRKAAHTKPPSVLSILTMSGQIKVKGHGACLVPAYWFSTIAAIWNTHTQLYFWTCSDKASAGTFDKSLTPLCNCHRVWSISSNCAAILVQSHLSAGSKLRGNRGALLELLASSPLLWL